MKYIAKVGDKNFQLALDPDSKRAQIDRQSYEYEIEQMSPEHLLVRLNGKTFDILLSGNRHTHSALVNGKPCQVEIEDARLEKLRKISGVGKKAAGPRPIKAPMPGLILKILVQEGQSVEKNAGLMIIEAMKMENEIRAEDKCTIKQIHVSEGQAVDKGQLLMQLA